MKKLLTHRFVHFLILFILLIGAVVYGNSSYKLRQELRFLAFDTFNQTYPRQPRDENKIIIIDIDDDSLKSIGQWPWPRNVIAEMVTSLKAMGAKAIAFDGVLAEPDRSSPQRVADNLPQGTEFQTMRDQLSDLEDHDSILAKAIEKSGIFIAGFTHSTYSQIPDSPLLIKKIQIKKDDEEIFLKSASPFQKAAVFLPELQKASAGNGSFMATPEQDGILRKTGLIFSDKENLYPSLSLEALRVALMGRKDHIRIGKTPANQRKNIDTDYRLVMGDRVVPIEKDGLMWVYFRSFDRKKDYISAYKTIDPEHMLDIASRINGRIVLVGASAEGLKDLRNTPLGAFRPGVEIHANVIEQILQNEYLLRPNIAQNAEQLFIIGVGLFMIMLAPLINVIALGFICVTLIAGVGFGSVFAYTQFGVLMDPVYPSLSVLVIFLASVILTYIRVEAEKRQVRSAFGLYISPDFMKELTSNPDKLKLGGEIRDLTVMFTDIRSFTTISEGLTPEELIGLMNDFLTPMSDLVMKNRGTIDKYMGDAMMAFWNAPLDDPDHERHACIAALKMNEALVPINEQVKIKAEKIGKPAVLLNAGIGINSGPCAVGNMGSRQRFAYSTLGDTVNLASRLEGQTKSYGVNILIGESTQNKITDMATLELDLIQVKGKTKPVRIFTLLGDDEYARSAEFQKLSKLHHAMIQSYRGQQFDDVIDLCRKASPMMGGYLSYYYKVFEERAVDLMKTPTAQDWDGVFIATSK